MARIDRRTALHGCAVTGFSVAGALARGDDSTDAKQRVSSHGYNYQRPHLKLGTRLLFQGDSITDMKWGRNEKDRNHYLGHSYVYLIAARLGVDLPAQKLEFFNRGVSGHTVGDLKNRWEKDAIDLKPDLLSVLVGINDVGRNLKGVDVVQWEKDYRSILESSLAANGGLQVVLLDPFVLASGRLADSAAYKMWRGQVDQLLPIVKSLAGEFNAVHIPTQDLFDEVAEQASPEHWIWDGVHPLPQGHEVIAREWIRRVSERWPS